ncbi:MAG: rod shape-determining protein MreC [Alphaproteobacteria bacterium]|nr:rod shape-determining protein MreC [Alphaproteobacteria bacterium]
MLDWTQTPRRPTAVRREQNLALVSAVLSGAVVAAGLILLLVARVNPETGAGLRALAGDLITPAWDVVRAPVDGATRIAGHIGDYFGAVSRSEALARELDTANARLRSARTGLRELAQLKRLMAVREPTRAAVATARLAAATAGGVVRSAMLSAGMADGVTRDLPVIAADGLIGRTVEAGSHSARVLLLTDAQSRVPVIVERTGQAGLAAGTGLPRLVLIDRIGPDVPLLAGDRIVTSGDGGVFPPGVPVGVIVDPRRDGPVIRLAASPLGTGFVTVERAWLPIPDTGPKGPVFDAPVPVEARRRGAPPPRLRGAETPPAVPAPLP